MSPFKVIRCRYYDEDGQAIHPYCSAGRRCTFLHPGDKGWPGGDPIPEVSKRQDERDRVSEWPRLRALKSTDRSLTQPHKSSSSRSGATPVTNTGSETPITPGRKDASHISQDQLPVFSIVKTFQDIARFQTKITQDREQLDKAIDKLATFKELSESLSQISAASAAAVCPTLDAITKSRYALEVQLDDDTKQLSELWDDVFNVFLRAICRQFDSELEAGTDFLRQEARMLMESFPKNVDSFDHSTSSAPKNPVLSRAFDSQVQDNPDLQQKNGMNNVGAKCTSKMDNEELDLAVNPPIGLSDNGWSRKRRRVSSNGVEEGMEYAEGRVPLSVKNDISRLQQQLEYQGEKIKTLMEQNEVLEHAIKISSHPTPNNSLKSDASSMPTNTTPQATEDLLSHLRQVVKNDILAFITPAFENQNQVNKQWEARLDAVVEGLKKVSVNTAGPI